MEASSGVTTDLPESVFFIARKGRESSNTQDASSSSLPASSSSSTEYYSTRIKWISERKSELNMSEEDADIEASKDLWTPLELDEFRVAETERLALYEENLQEMRRLMQENPESSFFHIGNDGLVLGKKIAEGGQGEIYDAGFSRPGYPDFDGEEVDEQARVLKVESDNKDKEQVAIILKVFKEGYKVSDLRKQWPLEFLLKHVNDGDIGNCNPITCGRLLEDGRFAFEMVRYWGDLRKLLDVRIQHYGNHHPPFMMPNGSYDEMFLACILCSIVVGMKRLHKAGIIHGDLKAANVLISSPDLDRHTIHEHDPIESTLIGCFVMDFECSIGVVGTGFWRAPEILHALKEKRVYTTPNLFTPKMDVYSFAMTCYEVLTGHVPFEEVSKCNHNALVDEVLEGRRPALPSHLQPWMVELMNKCWLKDPLERPSFEEIGDFLFGKLAQDLSWMC